MQASESYILAFMVVSTAVISLLAGLLVSLMYLTKRKQMAYQRNIFALKIEHEKSLLDTQLEIQEHTFQNISREIHDNINLSLTLAKLYLNTFKSSDSEEDLNKVYMARDLLSKSIIELSDMSKGLNSDVITSQGLIEALSNEMKRIRAAGLFEITFRVVGEPFYLDTKTELLIFRIVQEAFNNIIKHSKASESGLFITYGETCLDLLIQDNGDGFIQISNRMLADRNAGIKNMASRAKVVGGTMNIESSPGNGTRLSFNMPI
jgi:two-component system, NarL family, sensor kinase